MAQRTILLIADQPPVVAAVLDALGKEYRVEQAVNEQTASQYLTNQAPDLIIIDFDLKQKNGLQAYRDLRPAAKVLMLAAAHSIPLAVQATKLGVAAFLPKPIEAGQLRLAVTNNLAPEADKIHWSTNQQWLLGDSAKAQEFIINVQQIVKINQDIILIAEPGIDKQAVAEFIHLNKPVKTGRLVRIDLNAFHGQIGETQFWPMLKELLSLPETGSVLDLEDSCGTLLLDNVDQVSAPFRQSMFRFLARRKQKQVLTVIGAYQRACVLEFPDLASNWLEVPTLRERKEDLAALINMHLAVYSRQYDKSVNFIAADILAFLQNYDYPGNYQELARMLESAALAAISDRVEAANFPFDYDKIVQAMLRQGVTLTWNLEQARRNFEQQLYRVLLSKFQGDLDKLACFLDLPRSVLLERFADQVH